MRKRLSIVGLVVGLFLLFSGLIRAEEKGLSGYWKFDEGEGNIVKDSSGKGNNGAIHGATWIEGVKGKALEFDGKNDYVNCGNDSSLDIIDAITIEAWIKPSAVGDIVSKNLHSHEPYRLNLDGNRAISFQLSNTSTNREFFNTSISAVQFNIWSHIAATWDGSNVKIYINGVSQSLSASATSFSTLRTTTGILAIGRRTNNAFLKGIIDEVRIYNRALSKEEIRKHYQKIGKIIAEKEKEKEKEEKEGKLKALSSLLRLKGLRPLEGSLLSKIDFSIPEGWNYQKIYKKSFYYATIYYPQIWEEFHIENEDFIKDSLAWIGPDHSSSPELLSSDRPIIVVQGGDHGIEQKTFEKIKEAFGDRYLGAWNGWCQEWTRLWLDSSKGYVEIYVKQAGHSDFPKTRKDAYKMAGDLLKKRFAKWTPGQKQINLQFTLQDHYAMSFPEIVIEGYETYGHFPAKTACARGASRQYQKPWLAYLASFCSDGTTNYLFPFPECYAATSELSYKQGAYMGVSRSLHKRSFYASYMGGANLMKFEMDGHHSLLLAKYEDKTISREDHLTRLLSDEKCYLSPVGYDFKKFYDNVVKKHDRGIPYTPIGLLFDQYHNLNLPSNGDWGMGLLPFNDGDYMMRAVVNEIWSPEKGNPKKGGHENECEVAPPFGDIFDIVTNESSLENLENYSILFMVGNVDIDRNFYNKLTSYVKNGGNLFINIEQVNDLFSKNFLGVELTSNTHQGSCFYSLLDKSLISEKEFSFKEVLPIKAKPIVVSPDYENEKLYPLVTENKYGEGKVFVTTPYYLYVKGSKNRMLKLFSYLMKQISKELTPVSIEGEIEYMINKNKSGWVLTLINNKGVTNLAYKKSVIDPAEKVEVKIGLKRGFKVKEVNEWIRGERVKKEGGSFILTVPPGDIRIIEFKGAQS